MIYSSNIFDIWFSRFWYTIYKSCDVWTIFWCYKNWSISIIAFWKFKNTWILMDKIFIKKLSPWRNLCNILTNQCSFTYFFWRNYIISNEWFLYQIKRTIRLFLVILVYTFFIKSSSNEDQNLMTENIHTKSLVDDWFISSFYFIKPSTKIIEIIKFIIGSFNSFSKSLIYFEPSISIIIKQNLNTLSFT